MEAIRRDIYWNKFRTGFMRSAKFLGGCMCVRRMLIDLVRHKFVSPMKYEIIV